MLAGFKNKMNRAIRGAWRAVVSMPPKEAIPCFAKAVLLAAFLMFFGIFAPRLPWFAFLPVFLVYAIVATMGALYYVVIRRIHKQDMFCEGGKLSDYNRKWSIWLFLLFSFSLVSAFLFVLGAPRWDGFIWGLLWAAAFLYYPVFRIFDWIAGKQFRYPYGKAKAMKWSSAVLLVLLCLVYAVLSVQNSMDGQFETLDALRNPYMPFEGSPCVFLSEVDKLSALMNNLTNYGLAQIAKTSFFAAFIVKFVLALSIFLGVVSQFAFCLLSWQEIKSEFKKLPARNEIDVFAEDEKRDDGDRPIGGFSSDGFLDVEKPHDKQRYLAGYFVVVLSVSLASSVAFWWFEAETSKLRDTSEYTAADAFVAKHTDRLIAFLEGEFDDYVDNRTTGEEYRQKLDELIESRAETLDPLIDAYYDQCLLNVGSYLDWSEGFLGGIAGHLGGFGEERAVENFRSKVANSVDEAELERAYQEYVDELMRAWSEYWIEINDGGSATPIDFYLVDTPVEFPSVDDFMRGKSELMLWRPLDEGSISESTKNALLGVGGEVDRETRAAEVSGLIEQARSDTFSSLDEFEQICAGVSAL